MTTAKTRLFLSRVVEITVPPEVWAKADDDKLEAMLEEIEDELDLDFMLENFVQVLLDGGVHTKGLVVEVRDKEERLNLCQALQE